MSCTNCNSNTFKNYISDLEKSLSGGGYSVNLKGENIGNRPVYSRYADTNPPVTDLKGNLVIRKGDSPTCGQYGGKARKTKAKKSKTKKTKARKSKSRKTKARKTKARKTKARKTKARKSKSRKVKQRKSKSKKRRRYKSKGGSASLNRTYTNSDFTSELSNKSFGCKQPNWKVKCT